MSELEPRVIRTHVGTAWGVLHVGEDGRFWKDKEFAPLGTVFCDTREDAARGAANAGEPCKLISVETTVTTVYRVHDE